MKSASTDAAPAAWSRLLRGRHLAEQLQLRLDEWAPSLFGFTLLKVDALSAALSLEQSRLLHSVLMGQSGFAGMELQGDATAMPFAPGSLDACLLANVLDYSKHPHAILRETEVVLRDDGWLIITGFNPYSSAGLASLLPGLGHRLPPWQRMLAPGRLEDWLKLLGFEVIKQDDMGLTGWFDFPRLGRWRRRFCPRYCPSLAAVYIIMARKRRYPLTPIRQFKPLPSALQPGMACQRE
ncbi:methyltransferase domain-containing protein [Oceanisphaera sediminis]|uniref:Methyltransferase domain-containing protein n=1 Tax=Oceanisphaera sediminis TaxID=981381 RepID=A0ABP7E8D4_9GAMM